MVAMKRMSGIFKKTFFLVFFLFGTVAAITSGVAAYILHERMTDEYRSKGRTIAMSIAKASQEVLLSGNAAIVQASIDSYLGIEGVAYVYVVNSREEIIAHTFVPSLPAQLHLHQYHKYESTVRDIFVDGIGAVIDVEMPVLVGFAGHVHVGMDRGLLDSYFWKAFWNMQFLLLGIFMFCVMILYVVVRRISQPLTELADYAARLARHDFTGEIAIDSRDEIGLLARTMQAMSHELSALFNEMNEEVSKATRELRESLSYQSAIIDNLADGLLVVDPEGRVTLLNPAMRDFYGLQELDCPCSSAEDFFPVEVAGLVSLMRTTEKDVMTAEVPLGENRTGKALASRIWLDEEKGQSLGCVILVRDITHEKALDKLKTDFISTVSHELRTPMTSVLGFTKIIRKKLERDVFPRVDRCEEKAVKAALQVEDNIKIIVAEAERLTELINDVLDIAKMESGKVQWRDRMVCVGDIVEHSVRSVEGLCSEKGISMNTDIEEGLPPVFGDKSRLVQVMVNLLANAVKFMEEGMISCRAWHDETHVFISISDQGTGIMPDDLPLIFEKFRQVGDTLTEKPKGTGLGLPICKQIVTRHGGDIWVESVCGIGSTFCFSLPIADTCATRGLVSEEGAGSIPCEDEAEALVMEGSAMLVETRRKDREKQPLVLVVDDDPALGRYLSQLLADEGFRVMVAENGKQALKMARRHLPNLITMDLMMPEMDGKTAIHCLRSNAFTRHIPILVVTALSDSEQAGANASLLKPVDEEHMLETVNALLRDHDVSQSCIVLGDRDHYPSDHDLTVICPDNIIFCSPEEIWEHIEEGFKGFVFVPAELAVEFDLEGLSRFSGVQILILPEASTECIE